MRIVISAMIDLVPGVREQTLRDAQKHIAGTEAEPGCLEYTWTPSFTRPDRIHVFEEWADEGSLKGHFESSHYAAMRDHLQKAGIVAATNRKYLVAAFEPVYDSDGRPRTDFADAPSS